MNQPFGQMPNINMTPDLMYNIINGNPGIKNAMEQAVKLQYMQQQAQQMAPMLQQMAQNPSAALDGFINWQQQQPGQQQPPMQNVPKEPEPNPQEKMLSELDKIFEDLRAGLATILEKCSSNEQALELIMSELSKGEPVSASD